MEKAKGKKVNTILVGLFLSVFESLLLFLSPAEHTWSFFWGEKNVP